MFVTYVGYYITGLKPFYWNYKIALACINLNLNTKCYMCYHSPLNVKLPHFAERKNQNQNYDFDVNGPIS